MEEKKPDPSIFAESGLSFDFLKEINLDELDLQKEARYVGALAGSAVGSFISANLSWSLGLRVITVIGGSYSGALLAGLAYQVLEKLAEDDE